MTPARAGLLSVIAIACAARVEATTVAERVHGDLSRGTNVVVAAYVGLWSQNQGDPGRNLYWGNLYGHSALFARSREIRSRLPFLQVTDYARACRRVRTENPISVEVWEARVPGVPGRLTVVNLAYSDMPRAVREMALHLKHGSGPPDLAADPIVGPLLSRAYVIGYWGHNIYFGGIDSDDLEDAPRSVTTLPRGVFFVGCQSARWFPQKFVDEAIEPLLFTTTNMAPEAYVALALYDGLARGLGKAETRRQTARAYAVFQKLQKPPLSLFVNDRRALALAQRPIPEAAVPGDRADPGRGNEAARPRRGVPPAVRCDGGDACAPETDRWRVRLTSPAGPFPARRRAPTRAPCCRGSRAASGCFHPAPAGSRLRGSRPRAPRSPVSPRRRSRRAAGVRRS